MMTKITKQRVISFLLMSIGVLLLVAYAWQQIYKQQTHKEKPSRHCMLNAGVCEVIAINRKGDQVPLRVWATPNSFPVLEPITFYVAYNGAQPTMLESGIPTNNPTQNNLVANIYGLNMNMGTINITLAPNNKGIYEGKAILASCTQGVMQYQISFYGDYEFYVDFDVIRK